ncbi:T9SS type A sorting domain-containing protein [Taibaiella chishuiensis]|uniref:Putative secreted protein (Por secretion system target) n=1 Tax=Taibaiella chishuiensis TaxID=1434707 RepID=A0A2P8DBH5_9BACT|nr:T9SS type A sorting domain-containing protein [Taibaiella chishuiensis]PSK94570.1 putative secreted protein (Por secretion system target) [Taibaiella chishuiensis]
MKKSAFTILCLLMAMAFNRAGAQPLAVGAVVDDIKLKTIYGDSVSLYSYLDQGYTVLIDISATWCAPCWYFRQSHIAEDLYKHYGPNGTVQPGRIMVWFIEGDNTTTSADLAGNTGASQGDWVTGVDYPIIDYPNFTPVIHFLQPGATSIAFPTFLLICPNRKVIFNAEGFSPNWTEAYFVERMNDCPPGMTGMDQVFKTTELSLSPNPARSQLNIVMDLLVATDATFRVTNIMGQVISGKTAALQPGRQTEQLDISSLPPGMYVLSVSTSKGVLQQKFVKQ